MDYIKKVDETKLWNQGSVALWDFSKSNLDEESRIETIATVASVCWGKEPKDQAKLVEHLKTEHNGGMTSAFEFIRGGFNKESSNIASSLRNAPHSHTYEEVAKDIVDDGMFNGFYDECYGEHYNNIATFFVKIPIFIARQLIRHRSFSFQERSRRYTTDKLEFWCPTQTYWQASMGARMSYEALLREGEPPERARAVLGTGLYTEIWLQSDAPGLKNYFAVRLDKHTQKEHRELAQAMLDLLEKHQHELWNEVKPNTDEGFEIIEEQEN